MGYDELVRIAGLAMIATGLVQALYGLSDGSLIYLGSGVVFVLVGVGSVRFEDVATIE